jgi:hypothetical protein
MNGLLRRRVEYYEFPWGVEGGWHHARSYFRSLRQPLDVTYVFGKSMPRSGHYFLGACLQTYFGPELHYCDFYGREANCCRSLPCRKPRNGSHTNEYFLQKSHDFGFRDSTSLNGKYLVQYRSPIPRLQSNFELRQEQWGEETLESFIEFAESETTYFINFFKKWIAVPRPNTLVVAYEDLIWYQQQTLTAVIGFIQGHAKIDPRAMVRTLAAHPIDGGKGGTIWGLRDPKSNPYGDDEFYRRLEERIAEECGKDRITFHYL